MGEILFQNKKIFYRITGQGPDIILLHGFGENGNVFNHQIEFLKKDFRVLIPDLPGSGKSERLDGQPSLSDFADVVYQMARKKFGDTKFSLFGHSMGGYTTMAFVEKYKDSLNTFGLLHSSSFEDTEEKKETRKKSIEFIRKNGGSAFLKTITPGLFAESTQKEHPEYIHELLALTANISDEALIQYYHAMINRPDRSELLRSATIPVFFLIGKYDNVIPFDVSLKQSHLPIVSSVNILDNSGHMGMWEEKQKFNDKLKEFLQNFL